jgi:CTP-dependent riboflavin kinase
VSAPKKIHAVIFSDLGVASRFMSLDWVQRALLERLGFAPFPATLNVRPAHEQDSAAWESLQNDASYFSHLPGHEGACLARIYRIAIQSEPHAVRIANAAVLLPEVKDYPKNKIEIVAPVRLKDALGVQDGDRLSLEFLH